jgi:ABC-2 type transport system permease protein
MSSVLQGLGLFVPLIGFYFLDRTFSQVHVPAIERFGGNYITWLLVGVALASFSGLALGLITGPLRGAQVRGTLEALLMTRASLPMIMVGWSIYPLTRALIGMTIALIGGSIIVGISITDANVAAAALIILLMIVIMGSIGLLAASFTLVFKQSDPFTALFLLATGLLSGAVYPVEVLPGALQAVGRALPQTHAIEGLRLAVLQGGGISNLLDELGILAIYAAVLLPIGLLTLKVAVRQAKIDGSLAHY